MSVTETTRYIYCHAIDWLRISSCYQIYIYIHLYLLTKISCTEKKESSKIHLCSPRITISIPLFVFPKLNRSKRLIDHKFWKKKKRKITIPPSKSSIEFRVILKFKQFSRKLGLGVYQNLDLSLVRGPVENVGGRG